MRSFLKIVFGSCLGFLLSIVALVLLLALIASIQSHFSGGTDQNAVLLLDFEQTLPELSNNVEGSDLFDIANAYTPGLFDVKKLIKKAENDPSIKAVLLKTENSQMGFVTMTELADAIESFRDNSDKPIYAFGHNFSQSGYYLASEADSIFLNPEGGVDLRGFGVISPFAKDFLDKLGVEMKVVVDGNFKSAGEIFSRNHMSENNKLQTREFLDEMYTNFINRIAENRNIGIQRLRSSINEFAYSESSSAFSEGIVDGLLEWYQFEDKLRAMFGSSEGEEIKYISLKEYSSKNPVQKNVEQGANKIAVIYAEGEIVFGTEQYGSVNDTHFHELFDQIRKDGAKAIVLRVNSPGGSSFTSEMVLQELRHLQDKGIPVVASFGNYAASGGYYISCFSDEIVSDKNTLTGSIGAFSVIPSVSKLLNEHMGINYDTVKTAKYAAGYSPVLKTNEEEIALIQKMNNRVYSNFVQRVAEGRKMDLDHVKTLAEGRVWTGAKALELNLVDRIGDLDDAIAIAAEKADLENYTIAEYPNIKPNKWKRLLSGFDTGSAQLSHKRGGWVSEIESVMDRYQYYISHNAPQLLMPFTVIF